MSRKVSVKSEKDGKRKMVRCLTFLLNHVSISYCRKYFKQHHLSTLLSVVAKFPELESLVFQYASFGGDKAKIIGSFLSITPTIKVLNLGNNQIGDTGALYIISGILKTKSIVSLDLSFNNLSTKAASSIADLIRECPSLEKLDIGGNDFGATGLMVIANTIAKTDTLKIIGLRSIPAMHNRESSILKCIKDNTSITGIDLRSNSLTESHFNQITDILRIKKCLQYLNLSRNEISDIKTAKELFAAIEASPFLTEVVLSGCGLVDAVVPDIISVLKKNNSITRMNLSFNRFSYQKLMQIAAAISFSYKMERLDLRKPLEEPIRLSIKRKEITEFRDPRVIILQKIQQVIITSDNILAFCSVHSFWEFYLHIIEQIISLVVSFV
eukprot:TRINITY_DN2969_c0_g1_i2.p1 TRINITY_DN2969_c0_g1~~TRINITY_DN2969_c0_g1_i2.p1  ORF type:complete len:383 (-),score=19.68 TRINITY_DN2969_c0_g1_i2:830-1978(-)